MPGTSRDDRALDADERVEERRLADVRAAEDRDADRLVARHRARLADAPRAARRSRRAGRRCSWPCIPESGNGSPRPSRWSSRASERPATGRRSCSRARARACARAAGSRRAPRRPASRRRARRRRRARGRPPRSRCAPARRSSARSHRLEAMSTPPVSISRKRLPAHSQTSSLRSRVVPLVSWTTAARVEVSRLISVDLPTFGKPTIATVPSRSARLSAASEARPRRAVRSVQRLVRLAHSGGVSPARAAARVHARRASRRARSAAARSRRSPPCSPCRPSAGLRSGTGSPTAIEQGAKLPELPELGPVDRDRDDRHVFLDRDHRRPGLGRARAGRSSAACPRRRGRPRGPSAAALPHQPHRVAVGLAAADRDDPVPGDVPRRGPARGAARPSRRS